MHSRFTGIADDREIDNVSIDSRSLQNNTGTLFFALQGHNRDGHDYIQQLTKKGVQNFVVTHIPANYTGNASFFIVNDTLKALQDFAAWYRRLFNFPVVAITGSAGKTVVKEWLNYLLGPDYTIIRSPKSYNSQVGVPLSVIAINGRHNLGIFEAGISLPNEMEQLGHIINPNIGIFTNIGSAHDEGFESTEQKISEKLKLFKHVKLLICEKNELVNKLLNPDIKTFTWSYTDAAADVFITKQTEGNETHLLFTLKNQAGSSFTVPFTDEPSIENAINCIMLLISPEFNYSRETIQQRISGLYPIEMRLQVKAGINSCTLIDDTYSSDYQSLKIALDFLEQHKTHHKKTIILSDIFQSGFPVDQLYAKVAQLIYDNKISRIIGIGETISRQMDTFPGFTGYKSTQDFLLHYNPGSFNNETILIKGSRSFNFDEIVALLEEKTHETVLEINLNALEHNLNFYRSRLKPETKIMVMVKAFGYGSGSFEIAKELAHHKIDYLGVAFADEGIALRNAGVTIPVIVMNPEVSAFNSMIAYNLEPEIYSVRELNAFLQAARQKNLCNHPVHIKLDTGMHRLGFEEHQLTALVSLLKNNNHVIVKSIFSHLAASDNRDFADFTHTQIEKFTQYSDLLIQELHINPLRHILNTSGIFNYPQAQFDMVRLGIGLYGAGNDLLELQALQSIGTLKTIILQIKDIPAGDSVGYSRRFIANKPTRIATLPVGYADGIPRAWSNGKGYVTINGKKAVITGSICMDMLMADVTDIACNEGDTAIVLGQSPTVTEMAEALGTIPYEILTGISQRVKRIFYKE